MVTSSRAAERLRRWGPYGLLLAAAVLPYLHTLEGPLIWDDTLLITDNAVIQDLRKVPEIFSLSYWIKDYSGTLGQYRPVRFLLFSAGYALWGLDPLGYRLTNLFLYVLTVWLVYGLGRGLLRDDRAALLAGLAFALHPMHTEAVAWVKNHTEVLACLFSLLGLWGFRKGVDGSRWGYLLSIGVLPLAVLSKESAVVYPFLLAAWVVCGRPRELWQKDLLRLLPHGALIVLYGVFLLGVLGTRVDSPIKPPELTFVEHVSVVLRSGWYYLAGLFFPTTLNVEPQIRSLEPVYALYPWAGAMAFLVAGWLWNRLRKTHLPSAFSLGWTLLALLPMLNLKYITGRPLTDQRVFLASVGACWLLGYGATRLLRGQYTGIPPSQFRAGSWALILLLLAAVGAMTVHRNWVWTDPILLYEDTIRKSPMAERAHYNLGNTYKERGEWERAAEAYRMAIAVNPSYEGSHNNLGLVHFHRGEYEKAEEEYLIALRIKPDSIRTRMNLAVLYLTMERPLLAQEEFQRVLAADPEVSEAHLRLGEIHAGFERWEEAEQALRRARELDPRNSVAEMQLARVKLRTQQRRDEALREVQEALKKDPRNHEALVLMGNLLAEQGKIKEAMETYDRALALEPGNPYVHAQKGLVLERLGDLAGARRAYLDALAADPKDPFANLRWGALQLREGKMEQAATHLHRALAANPQDPEVHLQLAGLCLEDPQNLPQALVHLKRVLTLYPQHPRRGEIQGIIHSLEAETASSSSPPGLGR
jgi:tetratricopeptide (TPR) repeat protein